MAQNEEAPATKADFARLERNMATKTDLARLELATKTGMGTLRQDMDDRFRFYALEVSRQFLQVDKRLDDIVGRMDRYHGESMQLMEFLVGKYDKLDRGHDLLCVTVEGHSARIKAIESQS